MLRALGCLLLVVLFPSAAAGQCGAPAGAERWSDPATWGGSIPTAGDSVVIAAGKTVLLDISPPPLKDLNVAGRLFFDCVDINLFVDRVVVSGEFHIGSPQSPYRNRALIELGDRYYDPSDPLSKSFEAAIGARVEMHGEPRTASWVQLGATAQRGATTIALERAVDWRAGERIVLASTDFDVHQAEERVLTGTSHGGRVLHFARPLQFVHWGRIEPPGVDERGEVALLDRNIKVQGPPIAQTTRVGGHMMFLGYNDANVHLSWIELERMGKLGTRGRYPIHFHLAGDASGCYVRSLSIHHCYNRSVTIHGTNNLVVESTLSYDTFGHAFFMEDRSETGNELVNNLGLVTRVPPPGQRLVPSDATAATYWIQNFDNVLRGNVAAGSEAFGFWYDIPAYTWMLVPPTFVDNVAHSNRLDGFFHDDKVVFSPTTQPGGIYDGFTAYKNRRRGVHFRNANETIVWRNARVADNATAFYLAATGEPRVAITRTLLSDSIVIGESGNVGNPATQHELAFGRSLPNPDAPASPLLGHEILQGNIEVADTVYVNFVPRSFGPVATHGTTAKRGVRVTRDAGVFAQTRSPNPWAIDPRNRVRGLTFVAAKRALFRQPAELESGSASLLIYDQDGSLLGVPDHFLSASTALLLPKVGALPVPSWNAHVVPGPTTGPNDYGQLRLHGDFLRNPSLRIPAVTFRSLTRGASSEVGITPPPFYYAMNVRLFEDYDISFPAFQPRDFEIRLRFGAPQHSAIVAVEYDAPAPRRVMRDRQPIPALDSLEDLRNSGGEGYYFDAANRRVWLMPVINGTGTSVMAGIETQIHVMP